MLFLLGLAVGAGTVPDVGIPGPDLSGVYQSKIGTMTIVGGRESVWVSYDAAWGEGFTCSGIVKLSNFNDNTYRSEDGTAAIAVNAETITLAFDSHCGAGWPGETFARTAMKHAPSCTFKNNEVTRYSMKADGSMTYYAKGMAPTKGPFAGLPIRVESLVSDPSSAMGMKSVEQTYWALSDSGWNLGIYSDADVACK